LFSKKKCCGKGFVLTNVVWAMSLLLIKIGRIMNKKYLICLPKTNIMKLVVISLLSFFIVSKAMAQTFDVPRVRCFGFALMCDCGHPMRYFGGHWIQRLVDSSD
jgi:hypothetical protein